MDLRKLSKKYYGDMAETYDSLREGTAQWESEQLIVENLLKRYADGTRVLDIPVGTGRFLEAYSKLNFVTIGVDVSSSMLEIAREKVEANRLKEVTLLDGDIGNLELKENAFDLVVCIRFMDWVDTSFMRRALSELNRVCKRSIIVYIITYTPMSELRPWSASGFLRLLRQLKLKFYKLRKRSDSVTHYRKSVLKCFDELGLVIRDRICIDKLGPSDKNWRMGNSRDIYLLDKK